MRRPLDAAVWGGAARGSSPNARLYIVKPWPLLVSAGPVGVGEQAGAGPQGKQLAGTPCLLFYPSTTPPTSFLRSLLLLFLLLTKALLWDVPGDPQPVIWPLQSPCVSDLSGPEPWPGCVWASRVRLCPRQPIHYPKGQLIPRETTRQPRSPSLLPFLPKITNCSLPWWVFPPLDPKSALRRGSDNSPRRISG